MTEILVFWGSKGVGESILIKIDDTTYGIIDSFISSQTKNARVLDYLNENNISLDFVKFIVLSHCHHDHFRGLTQLVSQCKNATFYISKAIGIASFKLLISAYSNKVKSRHNYFQEIIDTFLVLKQSNRKAKMLSDQSKPIYSMGEITIQSFSPNKATEIYLTPKYNRETKNFLCGPGIKLVTHGFNFQSVVISVETENEKTLLGADQEYHPTNRKIGWAAIQKDLHFQNTKFDIFKIPHHGSDTGFNSDFWKLILKVENSLSITPYSRSSLPMPNMINEIKKHGKAYLTSPNGIKTYKKLPGKIGKKTKHLNIRRLAQINSGIIKNGFDKFGNLKVELVPDSVKL